MKRAGTASLLLACLLAGALAAGVPASPLRALLARDARPVAPAARPWTDDRAPVEWITDRMIVSFAARGGSLDQRLLPTAP